MYSLGNDENLSNIVFIIGVTNNFSVFLVHHA